MKTEDRILVNVCLVYKKTEMNQASFTIKSLTDYFIDQQQALGVAIGSFKDEMIGYDIFLYSSLKVNLTPQRTGMKREEYEKLYKL